MTRSVTEVLLLKYGISAHPGQKLQCPFCKHRTFSVKPDDSIGKCFHPSCGKCIGLQGERNGFDNIIHEILAEIFSDFHAELLRSSKTRPRNAYSYLVSGRAIHPKVVANSFIGSVPPRYDVAARFEPHILALRDRIETVEKRTLAARKDGRGRPTKEHTELENQLQSLEAVRDKLSAIAAKCPGWVCFFYTDECHHVVGIKFRKAYARKFAYFKPFPRAGLFGHGFFLENCSQRRGPSSSLIVVEGEFNQLQLQSLVLRNSKAKGREHPYVLVAAVGGVQNADWETIRKITPTPVVCYDNDSSGAGLKLVQKAREAMKIEAFTTPKTGSDLDSFIRSFGKKYKKAFDRSLTVPFCNYPDANGL